MKIRYEKPVYIIESIQELISCLWGENKELRRFTGRVYIHVTKLNTGYLEIKDPHYELSVMLRESELPLLPIQRDLMIAGEGRVLLCPAPTPSRFDPKTLYWWKRQPNHTQ